MNFAILGAGTWGTALAQVLADNGHDVLLYHFDEKIVKDINENHKNSLYFNDLLINEHIKATTCLKSVFSFTNNIITCVPSKNLVDLLKDSLPFMNQKYNFINTIKGFVGENNDLVIQYLWNIIPNEYVNSISSIIGPSHAEEVIQRKLTAICFVNKDAGFAAKMQQYFSNDYFRVYSLTDEIGAEFAASYKNAIAIGSGIISGLNIGDNGKAAYITRGLAEMMTFGKFIGGHTKTFIGLTGVGDLLVTCNSVHSRNFMFGYEIGKTKNANKVVAENTKTVEGYKTIQSLYNLSIKYSQNTPLIDSLYRILFENGDIEAEITSLMRRPLKSEF